MSHRIASLILIGLLASPAIAQSEQPEPEQPDPEQHDELPSLDELLGLEDESDAEAADDRENRVELPDLGEAELDRRLSQQEAAMEFREAAQLMRETAGRLASARDTGLVTQRLQEDIIRKLDAVIDAAQQNQQQSSSSSSSSSSQNSSQPSQPQAQQSQATDGENSDSMPPGRQDGPLGADEPAAVAAWGSLPARMRDALRQGLSDRYSAMYEHLTEAYYRKLAEEQDQ